MDGGKIAMNRSLQRHLTIVLISTISLAGILIAFASFRLAYADAKELQDDMLRQIAVLSLHSTAGPSSSPSNNVSNASLNDPESRVSIIHLPDDVAPDWLRKPVPQGLHTISTDSGNLRIFVHEDISGGRTVVYQPTDAGDEIALNSALRTLLPMLLLLPLLAALIGWIVRRELAPIALLAQSLDEQPTDTLNPLGTDDVSKEIQPFVHAINRLLERVNNLLAQQRRFIADAAHELRSPLTALSLQAQNIQRSDSLEDMQSRVEPLQAGIERARKLTEQLLTLAKTQADASPDEGVDVAALARDVMAEYFPLAEAKHIDMGLDEIAKLSLTGSRLSLRLLLKNALENALKYTPEGGVVTLRLRLELNSAVIEIVDNGPGIPAAERDRVFDAFYRMSDSVGEGNGLGLAIAREAALRLGGTVGLYGAEHGTGTIFRYQCMNRL